jgi:hypothetical protein
MQYCIISDMYLSRFGSILYNLALIYLDENYSVDSPFNNLPNSEDRIKIGLKLTELLAHKTKSNKIYINILA